MKRFALIGAAGYIAPRHMKAIKDTGNVLVAALDKFDGVGVMDSYFPEADFFTEFERFDRHVDKLRRSSQGVDYVTICTPNYLHDSHIRFALRQNADAICEKPMVLNPWNIEPLLAIEKESGRRVYNILQLRLHPQIIALKQKINATPDAMYDVDLSYITSRGRWYYISWKGETQKSGGIATNIGIHFFDMLIWLFGKPQTTVVHAAMTNKIGGFLQLEHARVRWFLSIDSNDLPLEVKQKGQSTYRALSIGGVEVEFSGGFTDLHTLSYFDILNGGGFSIEDVSKSIELAYTIRNQQASGLHGDYHPFLKQNFRNENYVFM